MKPLYCSYQESTCRYRRDIKEPCAFNNCLLYEKLEIDTREGEYEHEEEDCALDG